MWDWITPRNLIDLQRKAWFGYQGEIAKRLLADGYAVDADLVLDDMIAKQKEWSDERSRTLDGTA